MLKQSAIYQQVYNLLLEKNVSELFPYEFYTLIENIRFTNDGGRVFEKIREDLLDVGLHNRQIDRMLCGIRFNRGDSRCIEKEMCDLGMIRRVGLNRIVVIRNDTAKVKCGP